MSASRKDTKATLVEDWGPTNAAHITRVRLDLDLWDDEPEILDWVMAADRREDRGSIVDLLLSDVLHSIGRMSPAELKAFLVGLYARRNAYLSDRDTAALKGRAA
jgi:hypothetical protein